jgi:Mg/Co/Ni transporter MgtE
MEEPVGEVRERAQSAGWELTVVVNEERVVLGLLGADAWEKDPSLVAEMAMREGPVTFRPSMTPEETAHWMQHHDAHEVLVTSSDGRLIGVLDIHEARKAVGLTRYDGPP